MICGNGLEVDLVSGESKTPFEEHMKDGEIYVEAEPEADCFIHVKKVGPPNFLLCLEVFVDGQSLGYNYHLKRVGDEGTLGLGRCNDGISTHQALQFSKAHFGALEENQSGINGGKVQLVVYKAIEAGTSSLKDHESSFAPKSAAAAPSGTGMKMLLRSTVGAATISHRRGSSGILYKWGRLLEKITLNYCSTVGLIASGVLPKTTNQWDYFKACRPKACQASSPTSTAAGIKVKNVMIEDRETKLRREVVMYDMFDMDESDDE